MAGASQPTSVVCSVAESADGHAAVAGELADRLGHRLVLVRSGPPTLGRGRGQERLTETARQERAGFIVVPAQGALRTAILGPVPKRLLSATPCPLVVVPPRTVHLGCTPLSGERVLCGVKDIGDIAAANVAVELARALETRLTLVHVLRPSAAARVLTPASSMPAMAGTERPRRLARLLLQNVLDAIGPTPPGGYELWLHDGNAGKHLTGSAGNRQVACVVVGARGHTTRHAGLFGTVAGRLTRHSVRPVVLCPLPPPTERELSAQQPAVRCPARQG
jgi:nucleotide-binding universal stress UspA family protein